jgi:hypothetical protein
MYRDLARAVREGGSPEMGVEQALADHLLMEEAG